ncbi:MFS transporter [Massilia sp. IC2-476]|uniref:MFS transporter n=1 Tax=Massilia sp. IC2-476 TaxID=2887199 RepID=UPI001D1043E1|nr:MFS transporter [Massilia sp. IC2-476]MCC2971108.1 MFS transporter [Massilia sp. IC2-476]
MPALQSLPRHTRQALAALCLCTLLPALGTSIANVGLPVLVRDFGAPYAQVQWVVLAYLAATTGMAVVAGRLGDRYGRRRLLLGGIALFGVASLACGFASSLPVLVAARALQGCGAAAMMALALPFVGEAMPEGRAGAAMGWLGTMSGAGTALGPTLGGILLAWGGWPALFLALAPLAMLAFGIAWRWLPTGQGMRARAPQAQGDPLPWGGLGAGLLVASVVMTTLVVGPFYLSGGLGLGSAAVGLAMSCGPLAAMLAGVPAGRAVDRFGARPSMLAGLASMAAGCALLALLPRGSGIAGYVLPLAVCTGGYALFQAANNTALMATCAPERRGALSGMIGVARNLGLMAGASLMGMLFARTAGLDGGTAPVTIAAAMRTSFGAALVLVLAAWALTMRTSAPLPQTSTTDRAS